ncbi:MAG: hypothetical protein A2898_05065 [Candidatus Kerfeldbacteria bacterium RIFCSPLOWO2_01_FULL_48_11]|uniref:Uncharacterized protein n=1 Tax=Candidatus Kerfeldbacteria bacterium RIFCSPLOWO2_01_FULL_48_11 TaxID=1798543 RepID=A0A1G2B139_9BACT|nr:MAG: ATP synthase subunit delta [Parcubacteria group bacterium GW2011_GWA2_48_9]KKW15642.1 MAG: ATP synthase subunit delta [Parcubacteria group bacterium GW2011_GWC2_49_9]OGY82921.1 MAG: hypothetical protein A2898_05065 [Candidatus Kerfeldbacteria bacterium RIFCSPLOWO2_01_FULL_48_11]HCM67721.1 hypothetical protein [Candidatus Kerfeldbacteria bacterium]
MRKITPRQYAVALLDAYHETPESRRNEVLKHFLSLVKKHRRWKKINQIISALREISNQREGKVAIRLISARPLAAETTHALERQLTGILNAQAVMSHETDTTLIGGAKMLVGDTLVDGTVKHSLEKLQSSF